MMSQTVTGICATITPMQTNKNTTNTGQTRGRLGFGGGASGTLTDSVGGTLKVAAATVSIESLPGGIMS